jgi:hypothetical protein
MLKYIFEKVNIKKYSKRNAKTKKPTNINACGFFSFDKKSIIFLKFAEARHQKKSRFNRDFQLSNIVIFNQINI